MSNWTHVAAVFRVDDLATLSKKTRSNPDKVFGKECLLIGTDDESIKAFSKEYRNAMKYPEKYLPMGSEGSLHKSVWENPDPRNSPITPSRCGETSGTTKALTKLKRGSGAAAKNSRDGSARPAAR